MDDDLDALADRAPGLVPGRRIPRLPQGIGAVEQIQDRRPRCLKIVLRRPQAQVAQPRRDPASVVRHDRTRIDLHDDRPPAPSFAPQAVEQAAQDLVGVRRLALPQRTVRHVADRAVKRRRPDEQARHAADPAIGAERQQAHRVLAVGIADIAPGPQLERVPLGSRGDEGVPRGPVRGRGELDPDRPVAGFHAAPSRARTARDLTRRTTRPPIGPRPTTRLSRRRGVAPQNASLYPPTQRKS